MKFKLTPIQTLTHKLKLIPHIKLSLRLLQLPIEKLKDYIQEEIDKNPVFKQIEYKTYRNDQQSYEYYKSPDIADDEFEKKKAYRESLITQPITLQEHLITR